MSGRARRYALLHLLLAASLGTTPTRAADLFAAGGSLFRIDAATGSVATTMPHLDSQATDLELGPNAGYIAVSTSWGVRLFTPELTPRDSVRLGIVDAIEIDGGTNTIYALVHPGRSRKESSGPHALVSFSGADPSEVRRIAELGPLSFDLFLAPSGKTAVVTSNVGRELEVVDVPTGAVSTRLLRADDSPPQNVVLRTALWREDGREILVAESGRGLPLVLWTLEVPSGRMAPHPLPWLISGLSLAIAGEDIVINGRDQLAWVDAHSLAPSRTPDTTADDRPDPLPVYRDATDIAAAGDTVYLVAPSDDGARILRATPKGVSEVATLRDRATQIAFAPSPEGR